MLRRAQSPSCNAVRFHTFHCVLPYTLIYQLSCRGLKRNPVQAGGYWPELQLHSDNLLLVRPALTASGPRADHLSGYVMSVKRSRRSVGDSFRTSNPQFSERISATN